jgi:hypothetical protein
VPDTASARGKLRSLLAFVNVCAHRPNHAHRHDHRHGRWFDHRGGVRWGHVKNLHHHGKPHRR